MNADENTGMLERLENLAESALEMFTAGDVEAAMKASNFNKGLGPDGFDGTFLRPGDSSHRFTKDITAQILDSSTTQLRFPSTSMTGDSCLSPRTRDLTKPS